jgi:E3 ubiquitin-protein ligase UBR1
MKDEIESFYNSDQLIEGTFAEVVQLFFQTDESFSTLCRWGLVKLITITLYYLITCCNQNSKYVDFLTRIKPQAQSADPHLLTSFRSIIDLIASAIDTNYNSEKEEFVRSLYEGVSKVVYIYLRQMVIFKDLLSAADKGDNTFVSDDLLSRLPDKIDFEALTQICNPLTDVLEIPSFNTLLTKMSPDGHDPGCENSWFDIILCAKIPRYSPKILSIDYPGVVHLIDLPKDYSTCVAQMESMSATPTFDSLICLHCGKKIKWKKRRLGGSESVHPQHMQFCYKRTGLFYHPVENIIKICIFISQNPIVHEIPGPYLTIHGETKTPTNPGKGTLNKCRYDSLNRLWLNQGLYGFVTRSKFGTWVGGLGGLGLGLDDDFGVTRVTLDDDLNFGSSDEEMEDIEEFF